ncbi:uncharacterized protein TNCV_1041601 [Trichonephila clavipes]|nr:uncharacterized protein TNCV_1041601 [Trichonephila clavipes]
MHQIRNYAKKWKLEKQIQEIKTNKNISYSEARKLIAPQPSQTYAQITKPTAISTTIQTDPSIIKIVCPPLQCLSPTSSTLSSMTAVSTSSSSAQAHLLPSTSAEIPTIQRPIEYTTNDEDMIMYDVQAEELEPNPEDKYANRFEQRAQRLNPENGAS